MSERNTVKRLARTPNPPRGAQVRMKGQPPLATGQREPEAPGDRRARLRRIMEREA